MGLSGGEPREAVCPRLINSEGQAHLVLVRSNPGGQPQSRKNGVRVGMEGEVWNLEEVTMLVWRFQAVRITF